MTVVGFLFGGEFGEGDSQRGKEKQWIIPKAIASARSSQEPAFDVPMECLHGFSIFGRRNYTDESARAGVWRQLLQPGDESAVILLVVRILVRGVAIHQGGVAGGMYSGSAVECVDCQAGIVRQNQFSGSKPAVMLGLDAGILLEGIAVFYGQRDTIKARQRLHGDPQRGGGASKVSEFTGVGRGNINSKCRNHASIMIINDLHKRTGSKTMFRRFGLGLSFLALILSGCVISPRRDGATGGGGGGGTTIGKLYVTNDTGNSILRFDNALAATTTGNLIPAATIQGAATNLARPQAIVLDVAADRLFVADLGGPAILIFDSVSTKTGNVAPTRSIAGGATNLTGPVGVALDQTRNLLYVADGPDVLVYSSASTVGGNVAPARTITPSAGFTSGIGGIFLDSGADRLFLSDPATPAIAIFDNASALSSSTAASRTIVGTSTQLTQPGNLIVDSSNRLIVSNFSPPRIIIFSNAATTSGNVSPAGTLTSTDMTGPNQITLNAGNGDLYVADPFGARVLVFANAATANGNASATRNINGANTGFGAGGTVAGPRGVALDTTR